MCGITGCLSFSATGRNLVAEHVGGMTAALAHRGPDDEGLWTDADAGIAFGHRRLSIVDLSPAGHQPMLSADGRFVVTYNGEIYNHAELRADLTGRGISFRGHSDTEVMAEAFAAYGIAATVKRFIGMFAIGVWDRRHRTLTLIRDRLGIKPLYWAKFGPLFLFGSELKALRAHPGWTCQIDKGAVAAFMRHNYIPAPHSIYHNVNKLEAGCILTLPWEGEPRIERFWDARAVAFDGLRNPIVASDHEIADQLEALLRDAVGRRMVADVPVGAFLSGGVDSSTVVAMMQTSGAGPVRTYSIGFDQPGYDEAKYAAAVARHLKTEHTEIVVTASEAIDVIPLLSDYFDEPFADSSQIPTYLVSAMTRRHVTVALSGDGGDELFGGYNRYQLAQRFWRTLSLLPRPIRQGIAHGLRKVSAERWSSLFSHVPSRFRPALAGDKLHKLASVLMLDDDAALYRRLVSHWEPSALMPDTAEPKGVLWDETVARDFPDLLERMQVLDLMTYLPDDILTKVDRSSMAVGLEARVPLLDHRVVEFAWRLQHRKLIRNGHSKWPLRQVLYRHVPRELIERPKMGFGVPLGEWLRGPLRDWAENLLDAKRIREAGILDAVAVRRTWQEHLSGRHNQQYLLWDVLMFEAWRERWSAGIT